MNLFRDQSDTADASRRLADTLSSRVKGDVRFDRLARAMYATDASIYEIVPMGVVCPCDSDDVVETVKACRQSGTPIIARGAGTGLTGGAVGSGVQLDLSRYMNRVCAIHVGQGTVDVQPGVVLDELNRKLAPLGVHFAPDVATSSRATIGGMIANNSCGAHSIRYGRTVDHVMGLRVVLPDGSRVSFGEAPDLDGTASRDALSLAQEIECALGQLRDEYHDEIAARFPKILRSNGGYGLDRLGPPGTPAEAVKVLCGSEGTLGIVVAARLKLTPLPKCRGLVVLHFTDLFAALAAVPAILAHAPEAVELIDRMIIDAGRGRTGLTNRCHFLQGNPEALLVVEFFGDNEGDVDVRLKRFRTDQAGGGGAYRAVAVVDAADQAAVWDLRRSGLGLLMSRPGERQAYGFVEDTAVAPARLCDYIARFHDILRREGVEAGCYAHASVGCLHIRPVLNLTDADDVERVRRIAGDVTDLAVEFGGTITGEHGDGIVRSCWLDKLYGPRIIEAFGHVKDLFDPEGLLNPHKIVDPWPMTAHWRQGADFQRTPVKTHLDFTAHGGMAGLAGMCSGVGQCRQRSVGTMCPSYVATGNERDTTRARANALRMALSNRSLLNGLGDPVMDEVMDLCVSCKACKTECPTGVDMARLKAEYLADRNRRRGVPPGARLVTDLPRMARWGGVLPRLANVLSQSGPVRGYLEKHYGFDRRMALPRFATQTFRRWFRRHRRVAVAGRAQRGPVVFFVDTWTNFFKPEVGVAAVTLLERAGYEVVCPPTVCCGRPAISKGVLTEAKAAAERNVLALAPWSRENVPIVGTEPSCILTLVDEYPQLVPNRIAGRLAQQAVMVETLLARVLAENPEALGSLRPTARLLYHGHCHQKALVGQSDALALVERFGLAGSAVIDSGCCGMAGSFGHEKDHYEVARAIGEERLFPAIRSRVGADIAVSGFSCRCQIDHHTDATPRHLVEYLADALG